MRLSDGLHIACSPRGFSVLVKVVSNSSREKNPPIPQNRDPLLSELPPKDCHLSPANAREAFGSHRPSLRFPQTLGSICRSYPGSESTESFHRCENRQPRLAFVV